MSLIELLLPLPCVIAFVQSGVPRDRVATQFGKSIAILGDVDRDGFPDLAIGAPDDPTKGPESGCVFVVSGRDGKLLLRCNGQSAGDRLGTVVRSGADLDGDGLRDIIAEAQPQSDAGLDLEPSLRFFSSKDGRALPGIPRETRFASTDLDGDGVGDTLAALVNETAYVYSGKDGHVLRVLHEPRNGGYLGGFATSLSWLGDVDRDGSPDVAIGCFDDMDWDVEDSYVAVFSGRDAKVIRLLDTGGKKAVVGEGCDSNGDGIPDLPVGLPELETVVVVDGRALAAGSRGSEIRRPDWPVLLTLHRTQYPTN